MKQVSMVCDTEHKGCHKQRRLARSAFETCFVALSMDAQAFPLPCRMVYGFLAND